MKVVTPISFDRNKVKEVLTDALEQGFDQIYIVGLKSKQAYLMGSDLTSNMEMIGALEMCKMQIFDRSGQ